MHLWMGGLFAALYLLYGHPVPASLSTGLLTLAALWWVLRGIVAAVESSRRQELPAWRKKVYLLALWTGYGLIPASYFWLWRGG